MFHKNFLKNLTFQTQCVRWSRFTWPSPLNYILYVTFLSCRNLQFSCIFFLHFTYINIITFSLFWLIFSILNWIGVSFVISILSCYTAILRTYAFTVSWKWKLFCFFWTLVGVFCLIAVYIQEFFQVKSFSSFFAVVLIVVLFFVRIVSISSLLCRGVSVLLWALQSFTPNRLLPSSILHMIANRGFGVFSSTLFVAVVFF